MKSERIGIDCGGTFTDFILISDNTFEVHKILSNAEDPSIAIVNGLTDLNKLDIETIAHGTTVATNTLLERKGAKTGLITTKGFEDVLSIGRQNRSSLYDLNQDKPKPLILESNIWGITERIDKNGNIIYELDGENLDEIIESIKSSGIDSIAVSLLFSFQNSLHEDFINQKLSEIDLNLYKSISSQVLPEFREYERTSTVVVNSYVGPIIDKYLGNLEGKIENSNLRIMQSSGGAISSKQARNQPVRTMLSGPAGGVVGSFWISQLAGFDHIITLDMGGTSTDVSLCPGEIQKSTQTKIDGLPISVPMIDIVTVGAGGGSIAYIDSGNSLSVGPESASSNPGPACYGVGTKPTVTDANFVLERVSGDYFLGGRMQLNKSRSAAALGVLGDQLDLNTTEISLGVLKVVNSNMERAVRKVSLERGYDPRDFTLVAFGGSGPIHSCELASELSIPRVLVPQYPGVLSALGVAIADVEKDYVQTIMLGEEKFDYDSIQKLYEPMKENGLYDLEQEGFKQSDIIIQKLLDVRYRGQSFELTIECPDDEKKFIPD
ncbi:MAG: hydantoinase/oxoprolinase family protein, partial [SAR202 cluster bacterium]|nr:hydantoinase/oxoprolinase family protein [SAR202 cluster bacterium]